MRKVLFITIILFSLALIGASCDDSSVRSSDSNTSYEEYNCEAFETWAESQEIYESYGGVENDVHRIDRDNDGIPCEALRK